MNYDTNKANVVCGKVSEIATGTLIHPGVTKATCCRCDSTVYISPSSRQIVASGAGQIICGDCAIEIAKTKPIVVGITAEQFEESQRFDRQTARANAERN